MKAGAGPTDAIAVAALRERLLAGDRAALGRAITLVESNRHDHQQLAEALLARLPAAQDTYRIGITGVPGVGKSTFIDRFGSYLTGEGHRIAVLAIDPTSRLTGGSILGDKTRMQQLSRDANAFIRPSPTGNTTGGVAAKTHETIRLVEAAGFNVVLVETIGVGQSETAVAEMVDCFVLLLLAGAGDELQGIKRGILELADLLVITKADGDNCPRAERARAQHAAALQLMPPRKDKWKPTVVTCSALTNSNIDSLWLLLQQHHQLLSDSGALQRERGRQRQQRMWATVESELMSALRTHPAVAAEAPRLEAALLAGTITPRAAAARLIETFSARTDTG